MSIRWNDAEAARVEALIAHHPISTGCAPLGRAILPVARGHDPLAQGVVVRADTDQVKYACVRHRLGGKYWYHHVTVGVADHCIDALTGTPGRQRTEYLAAFFDNAPGELYLDPSDPELEDESL
jgi:hypothetical protein